MSKKLYFIIPFLILMLIFSFALASCDGSPAEVEKAEILFDIPYLLNKSAWEIKDILGEPDIFDEPTDGEFGILSWTKEIGKTNSSLMFGFDFYEDGSIADNVLVFTGIREEGEQKITLDYVLEVGNLEKDSDEYIIEIRTQTDKYINIWIIKK